MDRCKFALLPNRDVVALKGPDAMNFLQGLITNNMDKTVGGGAIHGGLLSPQGKLLFDFFVIPADDGYFLELDKTIASDLTKRLSFYKLRAEVEITYPVDHSATAALWGESVEQPKGLQSFRDPRLPELGYRIICTPTDPVALAAELGCRLTNESDYQAHRIALGVPEGGQDYAFGELFPHEACFDLLHGVDFEKGCYVGQEVVSRMEHRGTARKRFVRVESTSPLPESGRDITADDNLIGVLGSIADRRGLALVRIDRAARALADGQRIIAGDAELKLIPPSWGRFDLPSQGQTHSQ